MSDATRTSTGTPRNTPRFCKARTAPDQTNPLHISPAEGTGQSLRQNRQPTAARPQWLTESTLTRTHTAPPRLLQLRHRHLVTPSAASSFTSAAGTGPAAGPATGTCSPCMMTHASATPDDPHRAPARTSDTQCTSASSLPLCVTMPPPTVNASAAFGFAAACRAPRAAEVALLSADAEPGASAGLPSSLTDKELLQEAIAGTMTKKRKPRMKYADVEWPDGNEKLWWRSSDGRALEKNFFTAVVADASFPNPTPPTASSFAVNSAVSKYVVDCVEVAVARVLPWAPPACFLVAKKCMSRYGSICSPTCIRARLLSLESPGINGVHHNVRRPVPGGCLNVHIA